MPDSLGPLPPLAVNGAILAMPLLPLLMGAGLALLSLRRRPPPVGRVWTVGPTLASTAMLSFLGAYVAFGREPGLTTLAHGVTLARVGWLDVGFDVAFDRLTGAYALAGGAAFAALLSWLTRAGWSEPRPLAAPALGNVASGAFFFALLADAAPAFVFGAGVSSLAAAWLAARAAARPRASSEQAHRALGDALLGLGLVALAASFAPAAGVAADAPLRVVAVSRPDDPGRPKPPGRGAGALTMAGLPGATLRTEGNPALSPLVTPFARSPASAGAYRGRVAAGPGLPELPFGPARVSESAETRLVLAGPTVVFRSMEEQLALPPEAGAAAGVGAGGALARAGVALAAAGLLLRVAYAGPGRRRARGGGLSWLSAAPAALLGSYLLLRLSFAWRPPSASLVGLGLAAALAASAGALGARRPADAAEALVALYLGLAVAAAGVGAPGAVFAFGLAPLLVVATLVARSSPLAPDPDPGAGPLSRAWALAHALLAAAGASALAGRLPVGSAAGLALLAVLAPVAAAAALLSARALGASGPAGVAAGAPAGREEGAVLAAVVAPLGLLGAEPWFALARAKAPVERWASAGAAWGLTRPLAALAVTAALGLFAFAALRWAGRHAAPPEGAAVPAGGAAGAFARRSWRALGAPARALWLVTTAIDRRLWGDRAARAPGRPSGAR